MLKEKRETSEKKTPQRGKKKEKYTDGTKNRGEQCITNCFPYGCLDRPAS